MSKLASFSIACLCCAAIAVLTPSIYVVSVLCFSFIAKMSIGEFSTLVAIAAFPFLYWMFRKMCV